MTETEATPRLILASTSPYRKALMERLGVAFSVQKPAFDEAPLHDKARIEGTPPADLAIQLATGKAESLLHSVPAGALVIGSDQVAALHLSPVSTGFEVLHKPGTRERNIEQLGRLSGRTHSLFTAVSLRCAGAILGDSRSRFDFVHQTQLQFRSLSQAEIEEVVDRDQPFDCAGGYKFERAGIRFISTLRCSDPTAIEGLPLIQLSTALRELGYL